MPLVTGFDTHDLCKRIGHLPEQYSWQVTNYRMAVKELAGKMNSVTGHDRIRTEAMIRDIQAYDANLARGRRLHNDDQIRRLIQLRNWIPDRLRTCKLRPIEDPGAGPLIAIREQLISRKSMGGMLTDLQSRVLDKHDQPIPGLYAAGEAAGFGGGGISGIRSLEGTFLSNCILNGRRAAQSIAGKL